MPVDVEEDGGRPGEHERVLDERRRAVDDGAHEGLDVVREPRDDDARPVSLEEAQVEALDVREEADAQVGQDARADPGGQVGLRRRGDPVGHGQRREDADPELDLAEVRGRGGDPAVDRGLDRERAGDGRRGRREHHRQGDGAAAAVRPVVGPERLDAAQRAARAETRRFGAHAAHVAAERAHGSRPPDARRTGGSPSFSIGAPSGSRSTNRRSTRPWSWISR